MYHMAQLLFNFPIDKDLVRHCAIQIQTGLKVDNWASYRYCGLFENEYTKFSYMVIDQIMKLQAIHFLHL